MYDHIEQSDTAKSYIQKATTRLLHMVRITSLKKQMLINISTIIDFSYAWKAIEDFHKAGKAKAIGISHYCQRHIEDILEIATVPPAINQVQVSQIVLLALRIRAIHALRSTAVPRRHGHCRPQRHRRP